MKVFPLVNNVCVSRVVSDSITHCDPTDYIAHQAPLSMDFSRQEYWSGLSIPSPENFPDPGIEPGSPALQADSLLSELPRKPHKYTCTCIYLY